jgi:hypothetical protein
MNKQIEPRARDDGGLRPTWVVLTIIFAILLLVQLFRWSQGGSRADGILVPAALMLMGLAHVLRIKGIAQGVMLIVSGALAGLALVMAIIR